MINIKDFIFKNPVFVIWTTPEEHTVLSSLGDLTHEERE